MSLTTHHTLTGASFERPRRPARSHRRDDVPERIREDQEERRQRLVRIAHERQLLAEPDDVRPGQWVVWDAAVPGECELVTRERCTCHRFQVWGRCEHRALVLSEIAGMAVREVA